MVELSELQAARIAVRLAELRVLAAEAAIEAAHAAVPEHSPEQYSAALCWLLEPLRARSPEQIWRAEVRRQARRIEATYRRRLAARHRPV